MKEIKMVEPVERKPGTLYNNGEMHTINKNVSFDGYYETLESQRATKANEIYINNAKARAIDQELKNKKLSEKKKKQKEAERKKYDEEAKKKREELKRLGQDVYNYLTNPY